MNRNTLIYVSGATAIAAILGLLSSDASLMPALLFWVAVIQGIIALAAAADLSNGKWIMPARETILKLHPLLLIFPVLFLIFSRNLSVFNWMEHRNAWLNPGFFIVRNVLMLTITWLAAFYYSRASLKGSDRTGVLAVLYALAFVINQSLIAFDWVMSFEYPWVSTLFGGYFFIEALYAGIALTVVIAVVTARKNRQQSPAILSDSSTLLFGFSLLWAGQFFAQYLVIWYGNIPEEQSYLVTRILDSPLKELSIVVLLFLFFIPFTVLLSRKAKRTTAIMLPLACIVFTGIFLERLVFLLPVAPMNALLVSATLLLLGIPLLAILREELGMKVTDSE